MTKRTKMKMSAFFHRLIYVVLGVEAVIIMVYMMMGMSSCSSDNDGDIPAVIHMENRSFEGSVNYVDDYLDTEVNIPSPSAATRIISCAMKLHPRARKQSCRIIVSSKALVPIPSERITKSTSSQLRLPHQRTDLFLRATYV